VKPHTAIIPSSIALHSQFPRISIINEPLLRIPKRHAVPHDMVRRRVIRDPKLETIPITVEIIKTPWIEPVAPRVDFFHRDRGAKHEEVEAVVDVVPQAGVAERVAFARAFFASEPVGGFAVLARVAVAVGVEVGDCVV
jgi:hypothetical protein